MKPFVSVLTATIPERAHFLTELVASVAAQTYRSVEHVILVDEEKAGFARTMNRAAREAQGEWLLPFCDDDLMLPGCIQSLVDNCEDADIVYPRPLVWGEDPSQFCQEPPTIPAVVPLLRV